MFVPRYTLNGWINRSESESEIESERVFDGRKRWRKKKEKRKFQPTQFPQYNQLMMHHLQECGPDCHVVYVLVYIYETVSCLCLVYMTPNRT
jgi:hypothetical protein